MEVTWLKPDDGPDVAYELFAPFAHVEGRIEWCRIRSPTHGVFDTLILLETSPVTVYVASDAGERFMRERYPECATFRAETLSIAEDDDGRTVVGELAARAGPVRGAAMRLSAPAGVPEAVPYGGEGKPVWGSRRWTCWGVDLVLRGTATGRVQYADREETFRGEPCIVTLGSFGRIAPLDPSKE